MQKIRFTFFLFLFSFFAFSQYKITGKITDTTHNVVESAVIAIKEKNSDNIIAYETSSEGGRYEIVLKSEGEFTIQVKHIGFQPVAKSIRIETNTKSYIFDFQLVELLNEIKEVVVLGQSLSMQSKGDTLSYNLKAFKTGSEKNLKDVLKRLPGIDIDEASGKIKANGKEIDDLLVEGNKFFGDNHKLATENLPAEMISGIDLLKNFNDNKLSKDIEKTDKTALNIKVDEKYKGKPVGNVTAFGAYQNRYKLGANLFSFSNKLSMSLIGNSNNTNEETISFLDYFELIKSIKQYAKSSSAIADISIPRIPQFIISKNDLSGNNTHFGALNFSYFPEERLKIEGFTVLNYNQLRKKSYGDTHYFTPSQSFLISENKNGLIKSFFQQMVFNAEYALSHRSLLHYSLASSPSDTDDFLDLNRNVSNSKSTIYQFNNKFTTTLGQQLTYVNRLDKKRLLSATIFQEFSHSDDVMRLNSFEILMGMDGDFSQKQSQKSTEYGFYAKYTLKPKTVTYSFSGEYQRFSERFSAEIFKNTLAVKDEKSVVRNRNMYSMATEMLDKDGVFQYAMLLRGAYIANFGSEWYFLPRISVNIVPEKTHKISLSYKKSYANAQLNETVDFSLLADYQSVISKNIFRNQTLMKEDYTFEYNYLRMFSSTNIYAYLNLQIAENPIVSNTENFEGHSRILYQISSKNAQTWSGEVSFERRIKPLRMYWKVGTSFHLDKREEFLYGKSDVVENQLVSPYISVRSKFKNPVFNISFGANFALYDVDYQHNTFSYGSKKFIPFITLEGVVQKNFSYKIVNSYHFSKNIYQNRDFFALDFLFSYDMKKIDFFVQASDLLNVSSTEMILASASHLVQTNQILSRIAGFVGFGAKYKF